MNLLLLHELATKQGDGLHPDLLKLFEQRARIEAEPNIVPLGRADGMAQAGPSPGGRRGLFVPGNVLALVPIAGHAERGEDADRDEPDSIRA